MSWSAVEALAAELLAPGTLSYTGSSRLQFVEGISSIEMLGRNPPLFPLGPSTPAREISTPVKFSGSAASMPCIDCRFQTLRA